jgi:hypothetical protein
MIRFAARKIVTFALLVIGLILFCYWQNNSIVITESEYVNQKIPKEFEGYVIAHISDLHNKEFGKKQKRLLKKLKSTSPDIIVITGDLVDRRKYDLNKAMSFVEGAVKIAPVYYVSGNHEAWSNRYETIRSSLREAGVQVLDDSATEMSVGGSSIRLLGLSDPDFLTSHYRDGTNTSRIEDYLHRWSSDERFQILLSHRPELFDRYVKYNMDLVFSGHAHGGQFRLPFLRRGLVAPDQGFFPKYTSGCYTKNGTTMFVSRGLGNSIIPIRVFNRPEILVVTLHHKSGMP